MNSQALRLLIAFLGLLCILASRFVPQAAPELITTGVGLLGWALPAPGHGGEKGPPASTTGLTLAFLMFVPVLPSCASLQRVSPGDRAEAVRAAFAVARDACHAYERGAGGKHSQEADQLCLALLLGDRTTVEFEPLPDAGSE